MPNLFDLTPSQIMTQGQYETARFNQITESESFRSQVYNDGRGFVSIGYGYNLNEVSVRNAVFQSAVGRAPNATETQQMQTMLNTYNQTKTAAALSTLSSSFNSLLGIQSYDSSKGVAASWQ